MIAIIPRRKIYLSISAVIVLLSYAAIMRWGLRMGIDYTGGSFSEIAYGGENIPLASDIHKKLVTKGFEVSSIQPNGATSFFVRMKSLDERDHQRYLGVLESSFGKSAGVMEKIIDVAPQPLASSTASSTPITVTDTPKNTIWYESRFESIGPTIGAELRTKSLWAVLVALCAIVLYITYSFRKISHPVASWKYGICAFIALVHDVSIPTGFMAFMGHQYGWEVDLLFVTALLTILGFSIHDTIVVYDRIRENLMRTGGKNFDEIANVSVNQTIARSINTTLTTVIVLTALTLFGGETIQHFTTVLIIGFFFGTYSSIFIASPLLVVWHRFSHRTR